MTETLRSRLRARQPLLGTFIKTPSAAHVEIAALAGLDFVVLDCEHACFSPDALDHCLLASRSAGIAALVRVPHAESPIVQQSLDLGATGIVIPHVESATGARKAARRTRYKGGSRGFSTSPRAGNYGGLAMREMISSADATTVVIVQIESIAGVDQIEAIAAIDDVDGIFIGRADLAVDLDAESAEDSAVSSAVEKVVRAATAAGKPCGTFYAALPAAFASRQGTLSFLVIGSDQSALRSSWSETTGNWKTLCQDMIESR